MKHTFILRECFVTLLLIGSIATLSAQEAKEKGRVIIDLSYHQRDAEMPLLRAYAKSKINKKYLPVKGAFINFFMGEETAAGYLGSAKTNRVGVSSLPVPARAKVALDSLNRFMFIATVTGSDLFETASTELEIAKARIELSLQEEDSIRTIKAKVFAKQDSDWVVVPETELKFVVIRQFSDLPISEDVYQTDENGEVTAEFTLSIPGSETGDIDLGVKIEDHEMYGNLLVTKVCNWGLPLKPDNSFAKRTLWATRDKTPLWLLIFPNLIIVGVWATIFFLIYQIVQIRKIGNAN
jgi:hypothetical protein